MRLKIWVNAFIPRNVKGYTMAIDVGEHRGKTAVSLPGLARIDCFNTFKPKNTVYLTDQRGFSSNLTASHRMQSLIDIQLSNNPAVVRMSHTTSGTTEVDMDTGTVLGFDKAKMTGCSFSPLMANHPSNAVRHNMNRYSAQRGGFVGNQSAAATAAPSHLVYETRLRASVSDPLVSSSANIDYNGVFKVSINPSRPSYCLIDFEGKIEPFPAFECYAELNGVVKTICTAAPLPGKTVMDLVGNANRFISGRASWY